jgi:hypothetical protein
MQPPVASRPLEAAPASAERPAAPIRAISASLSSAPSQSRRIASLRQPKVAAKRSRLSVKRSTAIVSRQASQ